MLYKVEWDDSFMRERIIEVEAVIKLAIPLDNIPIEIFKTVEEILDEKTVNGKIVQLHCPAQIKKDLVGEAVAVKSGIYENMAWGNIEEVKRISTGVRVWEKIKEKSK